MSDYKGKLVFDQEQHSFFPKTYSDSVLFPDDQTLQDKYENNLLVDIKKINKNYCTRKYRNIISAAVWCRR